MMESAMEDVVRFEKSLWAMWVKTQVPVKKRESKPLRMSKEPS